MINFNSEISIKFIEEITELRVLSDSSELETVEIKINHNLCKICNEDDIYFGDICSECHYNLMETQSDYKYEQYLKYNCWEM